MLHNEPVEGRIDSLGDSATCFSHGRKEQAVQTTATRIDGELWPRVRVYWPNDVELADKAGHEVVGLCPAATTTWS